MHYKIYSESKSLQNQALCLVFLIHHSGAMLKSIKLLILLCF
jgi:hypothetical protein